MATPPSIGISNFARKRHQPGTGKSYFDGTEDELISLVRQYWYMRVPGDGETGIDRKVVVKVDPFRFVGTTVLPNVDTVLKAFVDRRQPDEDPFISVVATGQTDGVDCRIFPLEPEPVQFAKVVLYSSDALLENGGQRSGEYDWEVVAILASTVEHEPMHPLTMARNMLELRGGTKGVYTAEQFAKAVVYWSMRCGIQPVG